MLDFSVHQMVDEGLIVLFELSDEARYVQIRVCPISQSEVVSFCKDIDSMRERSLPSNSLLKSRTSCSSAVDFSVEQEHYAEVSRE